MRETEKRIPREDLSSQEEDRELLNREITEIV